MKKYELKYEEGEKGVFRMSTVESPATKTQLVMFDNEMQLLQFADDEKQIIYSVAMRPNMLIPRKNINGEPAMVFYTEDTVSKLQQNFFKNNSHNGATINHDKNVRTDMYCFESWIVADPEKDKATLLGMQVEKGDWVLGQKIDNPDVWQDVKSGKLQGFSIEAYLEPVLINNSIEMTAEEVDARIKKVLMETEEEKKKAEAEVPPVVEEKMEEVEVEVPTPDLQKVIDEQAAQINDLKAQIANLEQAKTEMSKQILEFGEEVKKGIKPVAMSKKYEEMSNKEKALYNRGKL